MKRLRNIEEIKALMGRGAIFFISHSGGKDSQTQTIELTKIIPLNQLVVVHADLQEQDWDKAYEHIEDTVPDGIKIIKCVAVKSFFEMVLRRGMWPSPKYRQCTSDLKRGPIDKVIRHELKRRGKPLAVNCIGIRAEESYTRAGYNPFKENTRLSKAGREVYDWLPIFDFTTGEVFQTIEDAGQVPHWIYKHLKRLSCIICIFGSPKDVAISAKLRRDVYDRCVQIEKEIGHTIRPDMPLDEYVKSSGGCKACDGQLQLF